MTDQVSMPRSRRALLAAAAGGAAALAASAAMPLTMAAHDADDVALGVANASTSTTTIADSTADVSTFVASATGTGVGVGSSEHRWARGPRLEHQRPGVLPAGGRRVHRDPRLGAREPDQRQDRCRCQGPERRLGRLRVRDVGVYGFGTLGIIGESGSASAGVTALARSATDLALDVRGKVKFSRSGGPPSQPAMRPRP